VGAINWNRESIINGHIFLRLANLTVYAHIYTCSLFWNFGNSTVHFFDFSKAKGSLELESQKQLPSFVSFSFWIIRLSHGGGFGGRVILILVVWIFSKGMLKFAVLNRLRPMTWDMYRHNWQSNLVEEWKGDLICQIVNDCCLYRCYPSSFSQ
jgi:hypothetical protein